MEVLYIIQIYLYGKILVFDLLYLGYYYVYVKVDCRWMWNYQVSMDLYMDKKDEINRNRVYTVIILYIKKMKSTWPTSPATSFSFLSLRRSCLAFCFSRFCFLRRLKDSLVKSRNKHEVSTCWCVYMYVCVFVCMCMCENVCAYLC